MKNNPYVNTMINKVFYSVLMFISNALLTRALGIDYKGEYTYIINIASLVSIISGLGIYQSIPFYYRKSESKEQIVQFYGNVFFLQNIVYLIVVFLLVFTLKTSFEILLIGLLMIVDLFSQQLNMLLLIDNLSERNAVFLNGALVNLICCFICFCLFRENLIAAVFTTIFYKLFYIIMYTIKLRIKITPLSISLKAISEKIKFGYLAMLSFLMITLNYKVDILMLKAFQNVSSKDLSLYSVGVSLAELAWFIPDVFKDVLFSKTAKDINPKEIRSVIRISNLIILIIIIAVVLLGKTAIKIVYGPAFVESAYITIILFLGIPAMSWFKIIYTLFNAIGQRKTSFTVLLISTILNVIANAYLIPKISIYGAGIASVVSYSFCGFLFLYLFSRQFKIPFWSMFVICKDDFKIIMKG